MPFGGAFAIGAALNLLVVIVQIAFGLLANSLALLADAVHNFGDVLGLLLSWGAAWMSGRLPTRARTYGFGRTSILAALVNAAALLVAIGAIGVEAIQRWYAPQPVAGTTVAWVAGLGVLANGVTAALFMSGRHGDLNIRSAFLHMAADALVSLGVLVAALVIGITGWLWLDPAASLVIAAVIAWGTWGLLRDSANLALDAVPPGIDRGAVEDFLRGLPGVAAVHDLHIWALSTTATALTAHLVRPAAGLDDGFLADATAGLRARFAIGHATLQVESGDAAFPCALEPDHVV